MKFGKMAAETHKMLTKAFCDNALLRGFKRFKNGRVSVDDDERSGHLTGTMIKNVEKV
jgi:hypothetical protein